jgi:hypothetical protein
MQIDFGLNAEIAAAEFTKGAPAHRGAGKRQALSAFDFRRLDIRFEALLQHIPLIFFAESGFGDRAPRWWRYGVTAQRLRVGNVATK